MKLKRILALILCFALLSLTGCVQLVYEDTAAPNETDKAAEEAQRTVKKAETESIDTVGFNDLQSVYANDDEDSVITLYLTVTKGDAADKADHTLAEVNAIEKFNNIADAETVRANVLVQEGDERGPLPGKLGYGQTQANGTIRLRGRTSTRAEQKSYRLDLNDSAGLWRGQKAIALNKHSFECTRFRNKLYFDLLNDLPDISSMRTQFVHVYLKDLTAENAQDLFEDYGLFTQVELPNKRYLRNHGLNRNGYLYKANMFEMYRYEDNIKLVTDPTYSLAEFSEALEPKGNEDHTKLIEMLDAVNDQNQKIEDVFEKYFDSDNYMTYHAYNILMGNDDSNAQNHLLYSSVSGNKWYYVPWDGDGCLRAYENKLLNKNPVASWHFGISDYWAIRLFNRLMRLSEYRERLSDKVEEIYVLLTDGRIQKLMDGYRTAVAPYAWAMPDIENMQCSQQQYEDIFEKMPGEIADNYKNYYESLKEPMPFYMGDVTITAEGKLLLEWDSAYDFGGELVSYNVRVSKSWDLSGSNIVFGADDLLSVDQEIDMLPPGEYAWQVIATNESGYSQIAFDQYYTVEGPHFGMRHFNITEDGKVENLL